MRLVYLLLIFMSWLYVYEVTYASDEEQFVCELRTAVSVTDHLAAIPSAKAQTISQKYVFILNGSKGTYINLKYPAIKGRLAVHSDGLKVTLVEQNTSDNLFIATIFNGSKGGQHEIILSIHSKSMEVIEYYPKQLYGTCD